MQYYLSTSHLCTVVTGCTCVGAFTFGVNVLLVHVVVSPSATCAGGVFPLTTGANKYSTCTQATCTLQW